MVAEKSFGFISGAALGTVLSLLFSGFIYTWQTWEAVFYWMGSLPALWCLLWMWLVADDPTKQCYITEKERLLIHKSLGDAHLPHKVRCSRFLYFCFLLLV
jgi:hypothetical protein